MSDHQLIHIDPPQKPCECPDCRDKCKDLSSCEIKLPPHEYPINEDNCPEIIHKKGNIVEQTQDVYIRYLKPVAPEPGPIIYRHEPDIQACSEPPLVIQESNCCRPSIPCCQQQTDCCRPSIPCCQQQTDCCRTSIAFCQPQKDCCRPSLPCCQQQTDCCKPCCQQQTDCCKPCCQSKPFYCSQSCCFTNEIKNCCIAEKCCSHLKCTPLVCPALCTSQISRVNCCTKQSNCLSKFKENCCCKKFCSPLICQSLAAPPLLKTHCCTKQSNCLSKFNGDHCCKKICSPLIYPPLAAPPLPWTPLICPPLAVPPLPWMPLKFPPLAYPVASYEQSVCPQKEIANCCVNSCPTETFFQQDAKQLANLPKIINRLFRSREKNKLLPGENIYRSFSSPKYQSCEKDFKIGLPDIKENSYDQDFRHQQLNNFSLRPVPKIRYPGPVTPGIPVQMPVSINGSIPYSLQNQNSLARLHNSKLTNSFNSFNLYSNSSVNWTPNLALNRSFNRNLNWGLKSSLNWS